MDRFHPTVFHFGDENNRSVGRDIAQFGSDLPTGANVGRRYQDVSVKLYRVMRGQGVHLDLKLQVYRSIGGLRDAHGDDWALAILVPTNQLMMEVSDHLSATQTLGNGVLRPSGMKWRSTRLRAKSHTTLLTPSREPSRLLL